MLASRRRRTLTMLALALLAGGCGSALRVGPDRTLNVALSEYRVTPGNALVSAGSLTLIAHNYGRLSHNLVVAFDGHPMASTQPIPPGGEAELMLTLSPGSYSMSSTVQSDSALGADATLTVTRAG